MERTIYQENLVTEGPIYQMEATVHVLADGNFILGIGRSRPNGSPNMGCDRYVVFPVDFVRQFHAAIEGALTAYDVAQGAPVSDDRPVRVGGGAQR